MTAQEPLFNRINKQNLPKHIAIIMDGNRRWEKKHRLSFGAGHHAGVDSIREVVRACGEIGIEVLTLYAFSTENWTRSKKEVQVLIYLLRHFLRKEIKDLHKNNVIFRPIGQWQEFSKNIQKELVEGIELTKNNTGLILNLALNYGGRQEIVNAINHIIALEIKKVDEDMIKKFLYTKDLPDPDLLIRTSGEYRISNFLLWQIAYAELYITPILWPDFRKNELIQAIVDYQQRERRLGA